MEQFWYGEVTAEDAYHESCSHPLLPTKRTLLIEIDLKGDKPSTITEVQNVFEEQPPETARIYLCSSSPSAKKLFQALDMEDSARYVEKILESAGTSTEAFQVDGRETLVTYDPRQLYRWLSIKPGQTATLMIPELTAVPAKPLGQHQNVFSQIRLSRGPENRYRAVWFDFRDLYDDHGDEQIMSFASKVKDMPPSNWQRCFGYRFYHQEGLFGETLRCATDFPGYFLVEILETDVKSFDWFILQDYDILPVTKLRPKVVQVVDSYITRQLKGFELTQAVRRKAEGLHSLAAYIATPNVHKCISRDQRCSFEVATHTLEISSQLLLVYVRRDEQEEEQRLTLHNRVAQSRQASSMSALTYCAAFFLPLSLSASFLGMETRVKDLDMLIYDFFGIASVLISVAFITYWGSWVVSKLKSYYYTDQHARQLLPSPNSKVVWGFLAASMICWMLIVASFFVGMLGDLRMGLIMLGVASGVFFSPTVLLCAIFSIVGVALVVRKGWRMGKKAVGREERKKDEGGVQV